MSTYCDTACGTATSTSPTISTICIDNQITTACPATSDVSITTKCGLPVENGNKCGSPAQVFCVNAGTVGTCSTTSSTIPTSTSSQATTASAVPSQVFGAVSTSSLISSSTSTPSPSATPSGLKPAAAAGIGIGAAIAGAALATIILFFLFARYKRRNQKPLDYSHHLPDYNNNPELGRQEKAAFAVTTTGAAAAENFLPQPVEDDAIKGELSRLRDKIKNHVQSFYHTAPVNAQLLDQNKVRDVAAAIGISAATLQELILEPTYRIAALRLYIAWVVLSRSDGYGQSSPSLLPNEVASFAAFIAGSENTSPREVTLASKWKAISGALLQSRYGQHQPAEDPILEHSIRQAISSADSVLATFIISSPDAADKRLRNLESIVRKASQLAFLLFSQPSSWVFQWNAGPRPGQLIVFPGLLETVGGEGHVQQPPRLFSGPEIVAVN